MNKLALITGGSRGIGKHSAQALAREGVDVIITYLSQADAASDVVNDLKALGVNAAALALDTSKTSTFPDFVERLKHELNTTFNRASIDYLFNNAGTGVHSLISESTEADFDEMYHLHLKGPFFLTQALLPMINEGGSILNISSGAVANDQ